MSSITKIHARQVEFSEDRFHDVFLLTLSKDDGITMCKAALMWDVDKDRCLEIIIDGGIKLLRGVLPPADHPRPPEL